MSTALAAPRIVLPDKTPRVGLALGGGGARGIGHILMLEALEELGVRPCVIAGTSIGAVFGAAYASGLSASQIRAQAEEVLSQRFDLVRQLFAARNEPFGKLFNLFRLKSALLNGEALLDLVLPSRVAANFEDLEIPLRLLTTDFHAQESVVMTRGALRPAIAASMALPVLLAPVQIEGRTLIDGGLVNPLPFDELGPDVDITVAIDVSGVARVPEEGQVPTALGSLVATTQILQRSLVREKMRSRQPDVYVNISVDRFNAREFHKFAEILKAAEPAKKELIEKLRRVLASETVEVQQDEGLEVGGGDAR